MTHPQVGQQQVRQVEGAKVVGAEGQREALARQARRSAELG